MRGGGPGNIFGLNICKLEGTAPYRHLLLPPAGPLDSCKKIYIPTGIISTGIIPTGVIPTWIISTGIIPTGIIPKGIIPTEIIPTGIISTGIIPYRNYFYRNDFYIIFFYRNQSPKPELVFPSLLPSIMFFISTSNIRLSLEFLPTVTWGRGGGIHRAVYIHIFSPKILPRPPPSTEKWLNAQYFFLYKNIPQCRTPPPLILPKS